MNRLVISIHDVAPSSLDGARDLRARVARRVEGPVSLLVVPRNRGRESWRSGEGRRWLGERQDGGDELVVHGYTHVGRGGRDGAELRRRGSEAVRDVVGDGIAELGAVGLRAHGFIAPSYAHPRDAEAALLGSGLRWWATRGSLRSPQGRVALPSIGLGASTAPRRALSPAVAALAVRALTAVPVVRLDLHPADLAHRRLARAVDSLLGALLAQGRRPVVHEEILAVPGGASSPGGGRHHEANMRTVDVTQRQRRGHRRDLRRADAA